MSSQFIYSAVYYVEASLQINLALDKSYSLLRMISTNIETLSFSGNKDRRVLKFFNKLFKV